MANNDTSDIGAAWEAALDKYCQDTGTNIKYLPQMKWNVTAIMGEQQRQVELFNKYRHNKGMTDKLRSVISKNSAVIQAVANNVANAASSAFPPSAAILTAFTYVMKASKNVSDDYDQVAAFFEIMGSLMERLSLLESKLPSAKNYKVILMRVFTSLMGLCGTATKYVTQGRFKHWLKALYKGTDDEIKGDYSQLETNIQRLESATMFATLATVMETKTDVKDLTAISLQSLKVGTQTLAGVNQTLSVSIETQTMVGGMSAKQDETLTAFKRLERKILKHEENKKDDKDAGKGKSKDSGAKKNAALNLVKTAFASAAEPAIQLKEIQSSFVQGTFSWVSDEEGLKTFMDGESPLLWVYGQPGIGKSSMANLIIGKLLESTSSDTRSSVAYYFFKEEHEELRSAKNMLSAAAIQIALGDGKYRDEVALDLKTRGEDLGDLDDIWNRFFVEKYPKDSDQRLAIVLDGLDEADEEDRNKILELLKQIKRDELSIQVVFTSRPVQEIQDAALELQAGKVEITKEKISVRGGDLWKIIMKRCKTYSKLKRLQKPALRKIGMKLRMKADSVLYVEHMLRRLNVLGRESLIFKELDKLPEDLPKLYELLLQECQRDRSADQLTALKKLFAWLAYSKRPLTFGEATSLIKVVPGTKSFSLEEEIDGRSARILDLATDVAADGSSGEESDSELNEKHSEDETSPASDNSITSPLKFQERSMRQYFRAMDVDDNGLRSSPCLGHFTIFEMAARVMNTPDTAAVDDKASEIVWQLQEYAVSFWLQHFLDIDMESATSDAVRTVVSSLFLIMNPEGEGLRNIETYTSDGQNRNLFGAAPYPLKDQFFQHFNTWLDRGRDLLKTDSNVFSDEIVAWLANFTSEEETLVHVARGHVKNMYRADRGWKVREIFEFARTTLRMTKFGSGISEDTVYEREHADSDILAVTNAFPEIRNTAAALKAIGMAFYSYQHYILSLEYIQKSLEMTTSDIERYQILFWIADVELPLSEIVDDESEKMQHVQGAYEAINESLALYEENEEVKKYFKESKWRMSIVQFNLTNKAICEIKLSNIDQAIITMDQAYAAVGDEADNSLNDDFVNDITSFLEKAGDYEKLLSVVERFQKWDLITWLGFESGTGHERLQHAAWECKNPAFMVKIYESLISDVDKFNYGAHVRSNLASAYQFVFPNYDEAKRLLLEVIDGKKGMPWSDGNEGFLFVTRLQLADVLVKQFKESSDPDQKTMLHGEMKNLALQHTLALSKDYNPYESPVMISFALMTGKMGPTTELQTLLDKTFRACIDALTDTLAGNDSSGLRLLAKTLAFIPEMKRDAQIAYSLQFSIIDEEVFKSSKDAEEGNSIDGPVVEEQQAPDAEKPNGQALVPPKPESTTVNQDSSAPTETVSEQLNPESTLFCDGCGNFFSDWSLGPIYECIICTNCDLCEKCWTKIDRCNKVEPWTEWKSYCGKDHKYIKGPVAGWKGVNGGVMKFEYPASEEGRTPQVEEIKFTDWLDGVQERWADSWKQFWRKEELVVDIF